MKWFMRLAASVLALCGLQAQAQYFEPVPAEPSWHWWFESDRLLVNSTTSNVALVVSVANHADASLAIHSPHLVYSDGSYGDPFPGVFIGVTDILISTSVNGAYQPVTILPGQTVTLEVAVLNFATRKVGAVDTTQHVVSPNLYMKFGARCTPGALFMPGASVLTDDFPCALSAGLQPRAPIVLASVVPEPPSALLGLAGLGTLLLRPRRRRAARP